ncbi:MAG: metalloregulator ArsR/SmtB family transcription factor [Chloracidobacterium sp.]|uniref:Winged helix-turn-helix transcriptional regulator n=1 Tax=Chloracidobacterium validum TaxID=2821543 RepID=A0ABX8BA69_9BACT|nr:metalloregulator ArsR/SmtB family transcription factor [Chloracidobacterium validum]QUW03574.1 winged helix-turn-helix transcriptional regulator [Chloracidobacterium validum]
MASTCTTEHHPANQDVLEARLAWRVADIFKAFADPTRVKIIALLDTSELCVGEMCLVLGMSQPAISSQLRLLRTLGVVTVRREGKHAYYALADEHIRNLFHQGLAHARHE